MLKKFLLSLILIVSLSFAYDPGIITDKYTYSANESIFASGTVKINTTVISNVSVTFTVKDVSDTAVSSSSFVTNSTGQFNSTFSLSSSGNYTLIANVSGDFVKHFIKVKPYAKIYLSLNRPSYTAGAGGVLEVSALDANSLGVASQGITSSIRSANGTVLSTLSACTTDSLGECKINFTAPADDGSYTLEVNNFESVVPLIVGGYDAFMKVSPSITGRSQNVTVRVTVKNSNGNGITASTRQLLITMPNGTQATIASIPAANDSSGSPLTGVYEAKLAYDGEGSYEVKATIQPQGSNLSRELIGRFSVNSYLVEVVSWPGSASLFTPGETASLGIRLRNATSNTFMTATKCGSGSCTTSLASASILDSSGVPTGYAVSVSEQATMSLYRMDVTLPSSAKSGTYKVRISINDSYGTGEGEGYFTVQVAKGKMRAVDKFPNGVTKETSLPGKQIALEFSVFNASGAVNIASISSYTIRDMSGNDKTSLFGTGVAYSGNNNKSYINLTAPKQGGRYNAKAKVSTALGSVDIEGLLFVDVLDISIRPQAIGGGSGPGGMIPFGGPGFMFAFRPNDTVQLIVSVTTASEKRGSEGFMGEGMSKGGAAGGGHSAGTSGMFGIGGGSAVQGAQIKVDRILNLNTDEDITTSTTITNCITDNTGACTLSLKSNVNGQNWTGGFHILSVNVTTSDNQSDNGEGFFEVRRYFVNVQTRAATAKNATSSGFQSFSDWFIGPDDNLNITISAIEPGTWRSVNQNGNATILGVYYGGNMGEFIFPPKLQDNTNATVNITGGNASAVISAPASGWKSGFYIIKVLVNISSLLDTGESFMMVKIYEGFGQPINPTTRQMDLTVNSNENVSVSINVFDVRNNRPAANLTVTLNKIMSFTSFPPAEITYDKSQVATGTTDANGQVVMTLPVSSGGWATGDHLAMFDVTNGSVSDSIPGFFMVRNFFVELSPAKWRFATNETVAFNVTVSSDPSWMRQMFGGGCPAGDPMCAPSGGPGPGGPGQGGPGGDMFGGGGPINQIDITAAIGAGYDIDNDGIKDINITSFNMSGPNNLTVPVGSNASVSRQFWCDSFNPSQCAPGAVANVTNGFDGFGCESVANYSGVPAETHNASGPSFFCVNTSMGVIYKVQPRFADELTRQVAAIRHVSGSVGGIAPIDLTGAQGFNYYNATLKSIRVVKFDFTSGETLLRHGTDYNVTSATGGTIGENKIVITGVGSFKLVPITAWSSGFYRVIAEFNTSTATETGESGFSIETFFANCYRSSWGAVGSGTNVSVQCDVTDPATGGNYSNRVDMRVESVRNIFTFQSVGSGWTATSNHTNATQSSRTLLLSQSLGNGQYEATVKLNATSSDAKHQSIWFEVKDFEPTFFTEKWAYTSSENVSLIAQAILNSRNVAVNISNSSSASELIVYRYDKSTGSKSAVSGITISTAMNQGLNYPDTWRLNATMVNLTKSGGWDEGDYEVVANITRVDANGVATGGEVEVKAWFSVRLFDVWGWSELWSNHPKSNITLRVHIGNSGSWWQNYNGIIRANLTAVTNTQTGAALARGTDYNATNMTANPSDIGDLNVSVIPLSSSGLSIGSYRATVQVMDTSGKSVSTDIWFETRSLQLSAYPERYEYAPTDEVVLVLNIYSLGGGNSSLTGGRLVLLNTCGSTTCSNIAVTSVNATFNAATNRIILNASALSAGSYWAMLEVNDTQNATISAGVGFVIRSFGVSGYIYRPSSSREHYYINETMTLNVTGTPGVNITNITYQRTDCNGVGVCTETKFTKYIGRVLEGKNELVNLTPAGLNNTWPMPYAGVDYGTYTTATYNGAATTFYSGWAGISFPWVWNITKPASIAPTENIMFNATIYVIPFNNTQKLANAVINVTNIYSTATWLDVNTTPGAWNFSASPSNSDGIANVTIRPDINRMNWTNGRLSVQFTVKYGNATTRGDFEITGAQKTLNVLGKGLKNSTGAPGGTNAQTLVTAPSCSASCWYNFTVAVNNPQSTDATADVSVITTRLNSSATVTNWSAIALSSQSIPSGASPTFNFTYNVTGITNITHELRITPQAGGFAALKTTLSYRSV